MSFPTYSTNAFNNTNPARGGLAQSVKENGISGLAGEAMVAGDRVKIDDSVTTPGIVKFLKADPDEAAVGVVKFAPNADTYAAGDVVEVLYSGGPAVYQVASGTLTPGALVGMDSDGELVAVDGTHLQMGLLLDYCTINQVGRVILGFVAC